MSSTSRTDEKKKEASKDLLKSIDLWLKWDQCEKTRAEIEQFNVNQNCFVDPNNIVDEMVLFSNLNRKPRNGMN